MTDGVPSSLRWLIREQAGVVTRQQAVQGGMPVGAIKARVKFRRWQQVHRGVYATFTGPMSRNAELWAAVLYAGRDAQLSHETAAELLHLTDRRAPFIHVTIPADRRVAPPRGVVVHTSSHTGLIWRPPRGFPPYTLAEQTITDLANAATSLDDVVAWVTAGFNRRLVSEHDMKAAMAERKKLRWREQLDEIIPMAAGGTHSLLEYRYDRDVERAHGLPPADKQVPFQKPDGSRGFRDRYYREYGLVIELDGKQYHPDDLRDRDQDRDNDTTATAGATLRYRWIHVTRERCASAAQVHAALRMRGYAGKLRPCGPACTAAGGPAAGPGSDVRATRPAARR